MAYNTTNHVYYLKQYSEIKDELTEQQLASFLQDVLEGQAKVSVITIRYLVMQCNASVFCLSISIQVNVNIAL